MENSKKDYYAEKISEIKNLINVDLDKAHSLLAVELSMPYIPERYEPTFLKLKDEINSIILNKEGFNYELSQEQVIETLQKSDSIKIGLALEKLRNFNLKALINELQIIFNSKQPIAIKAVIYEYLCEQKIDHDFLISGLKINATKNFSIISPKEYKDAYLYIEENIVHDPSLKEVAKSILEIYALNLFPKFVNSNHLGKVIINIASESLGLKVEPLNEELAKIKDKVNKIYKNNL